MTKRCDICNSNYLVSKNKKTGLYLCNRHRKQIQKHGKFLKRTRYDPNEIVEYEDYAEVILYNKNCHEKARATIDLDDINRIKKHKWSLNNKGYVVTRVNKKEIKLHRFIINAKSGYVVDHIDGNTLNNRKSNLRLCTQQQNIMNRKLNKNNTSGVKGVYFKKDRGKYIANIKINGKTKYLGIFDTKHTARKAREKAEKKHFGKYRYKGNEIAK